MNIIAIVVTFNRLQLLKECIHALQQQSRLPDEIIVVNNSSTDGTTEWLKTQSVTTVQQENRGGSWGFYTGVKTAYQKKADWIWIMDDDTIPSASALEELIKPIDVSTPKPGLLCSRVLWIDGCPHKMNLPHFANSKMNNDQTQLPQEITLIKSCSFVSLLVSKEAIKRAGYPIKEFFIWVDDMEFTQRITRNGFEGLFVPDSIVLHKTPDNHYSSIYKDHPKNLWKYRYGIRNELIVSKLNKGTTKFLTGLLKRVFVFPFRILHRRKDHKWQFIKTTWLASFSAVGFNPKIEKPE